MRPYFRKIGYRHAGKTAGRGESPFSTDNTSADKYPARPICVYPCASVVAEQRARQASPLHTATSATSEKGARPDETGRGTRISACGNPPARRATEDMRHHPANLRLSVCMGGYGTKGEASLAPTHRHQCHIRKSHTAGRDLCADSVAYRPWHMHRAQALRPYKTNH